MPVFLVFKKVKMPDASVEKVEIQGKAVSLIGESIVPVYPLASEPLGSVTEDLHHHVLEPRTVRLSAVYKF